MSHGVKGHTEADGLSTAMRLLMHYTGDIHQPLHATSRVDKEYPAGDRGGNSFPVPSIDGAKNLHSVWDSVVYAEATDYKLVSEKLSLFIRFYSHFHPKTGLLSPLRPRNSSQLSQSTQVLLRRSTQLSGLTTLSRSLKRLFTVVSKFNRRQIF